MKKIPVAFCFDDNILLAAAVCITSLLENANHDTFYDIFILHDEKCKFPHTDYFSKLNSKYENFKISYRSVGNAFSTAFQIRGITSATYYRLLIPELVPEYSTIMYHDVDVIFRSDLSDIFERTQMCDNYVAGVISPVSLDKRLQNHIKNLNLDPMQYISAGNIILNSGLMLKDGILEKFKLEVAHSSYEFQDMDIINIVCQGRIINLPPEFCGTIEIFHLATHQIEQPLYSSKELTNLLHSGIIHYNGNKPWKDFCPNFDIWWEYYRKSSYYDARWYFDFYRSKLDDLDRLSFLKRLKLVFRYFKVRK